VLREHFRANHWWSTQHPREAAFAAIARECRGDGTVADFFEQGRPVGTLTIPLPGLHNLSNVTAAVAACRLEGVSFAELQQAVTRLQAPGRRFDYRGTWQERLVVDDYAHHPSEVQATLAMAQLMVRSGATTLPQIPRRVLAVFQPHRYSRTGQFLDGFAQALSGADAVLLAPLYSAGEQPISGVSSEALAAAIAAHKPQLAISVATSNDELTALVANQSRPGDLVLAMGAGDINGLWDRLSRFTQRDASDSSLPLAA
jgi:UDP-N-acetylmuramate--alanine ligase